MLFRERALCIYLLFSPCNVGKGNFGKVIMFVRDMNLFLWRGMAWHGLVFALIFFLFVVGRAIINIVFEKQKKKYGGVFLALLRDLGLRRR